MPIPSEVPTSFVPRAPMRQLKQSMHFDLSGAIAFVATIAFALAALAALGMFLYGYYLERQLTSRQAELHTIQQSLDQATVATYSHTSQQITAATTLLNQHTTPSRLFDLLEAKTVQNIRFTSLSLLMQKDHTDQLKANGVARNFDALVAESRVFLDDNNLSSVVFSNIEPGRGKTSNTVDFSVAAIVNKSIAANFTALVKPSVASSTQASSSAAPSTTLTP